VIDIDGQDIALVVSTAAALASAAGALWAGKEARAANAEAKRANDAVEEQRQDERDRLEAARSAARVRWEVTPGAGGYVLHNRGTHAAVNVWVSYLGGHQVSQDAPFVQPSAGGRVWRDALGGPARLFFPTVAPGAAVSFRLVELPTQSAHDIGLSWDGATRPDYVGETITDPDLPLSGGRVTLTLVS
jgi:hypothetical protein